MLDPDVKRLATDRNFGVISTLNRKGEPRTHVMWVDADDDHVIVNTEVHRQKYRDVAADPRVTVTVWTLEDPTRFAEVRGRVTEEVRGDEARAHIDSLARKYTGKDYAAPVESERVILKITPEKVYKRKLG